MSVAQVLKDAKALIADESHWTQGTSARDKDGWPLSDNASPAAVCWCSIGALARVADTGPAAPFHLYPTARYYLNAAAAKAAAPGSHSGKSIVNFNDTHTHAEVMEVWNKAIQLAEVKK